jgi:hypothetical protein
LAWEYPELTPYQYASNDPIGNIDIDGLEGGITTFADGVKTAGDLTHRVLSEAVVVGHKAVGVAPNAAGTAGKAALSKILGLAGKSMFQSLHATDMVSRNLYPQQIKNPNGTIKPQSDAGYNGYNLWYSVVKWSPNASVIFL